MLGERESEVMRQTVNDLNFEIARLEQAVAYGD
jgi:hypothetical protein